MMLLCGVPIMKYTENQLGSFASTALAAKKLNDDRYTKLVHELQIRTKKQKEEIEFNIINFSRIKIK